MKKIVSFLTGLVFGGLLGATLGLLLAPASGNQLRADLQNYTKQVENEVRLAAEERRSEMEEQLAHLRGEIHYEA